MIRSASAAEALGMLETAAGLLAALDAARMPAEAAAEVLRGMERADAVQAAARGRLMQVFDAKDGHLADGQRTTRAWLVHSLRVTRGQAAEHKAVQALAREHQPLLAGLIDHAVTKSVALELARWTMPIPPEFRAQAEEILIAAARAGAGLARAGGDLRGDPLATFLHRDLSHTQQGCTSTEDACVAEGEIETTVQRTISGPSLHQSLDPPVP
jgi:hypothetical protein